MIIENKMLGTVEIDEQAIVEFPAGIPAFEDDREFVIIPLDEKEGPFFYLLSVNNSDLCLVTVDPFVFFPDYSVDVSDEELKKLNADQNSLSLLSVLNIPEDFKKATANLFAPLIIDTVGKRGMQYIPQKSDYKTKHLIFPQASENKSVKNSGGE